MNTPRAKARGIYGKRFAFSMMRGKPRSIAG